MLPVILLPLKSRVDKVEERTEAWESHSDGRLPAAQLGQIAAQQELDMITG